MVLAWENLRSFCSFLFILLLLLLFFIYLHWSLSSLSTLSMFWWCIFIWFPGYFSMSLALRPGFSDQWKSPPALSSTPITFDCLFFFIYFECYGFEWAFFTQRYFLPYTPSWPFWHIPTFWHNLLLSRFHWEPAAIFWKVAGLHSDPGKHRPVPCVCLIHSDPQYFIHLKSVFMHVNVAKVLLVVKTLIRSAATLFSSPENIKQQPS